MEEEAESLRSELQAAKAMLPCWAEELQAAEAWLADSTRRTEKAELEKEVLTSELAQLRSRCDKPLSPATSEEGRPVEGNYEEGSFVGYHFDPSRHIPEPLLVPKSPRSSLDGGSGLTSTELASLAHAQDLKQVQSETTKREASLSQLRRQRLQIAEQAMQDARAEASELRIALQAAEAEGRHLMAERKVAEEQEEPLREWVKHVETELRRTRSENSRLSVALAAALKKRDELLREASDVQPLRDAGLDIQQVMRLQENERGNASRKALLEEEIAAQNLRRAKYFAEASHYQQAVEYEEQRQDKSAHVGNDAVKARSALSHLASPLSLTSPLTAKPLQPNISGRLSSNMSRLPAPPISQSVPSSNQAKGWDSKEVPPVQLLLSPDAVAQLGHDPHCLARASSFDEVSSDGELGDYWAKLQH